MCGLLTGTSSFLIDNSVVTELQSALRKELEIDDSASECESESGMSGGNYFSNFEKIHSIFHLLFVIYII